jgi:hypothetical protein
MERTGKERVEPGVHDPEHGTEEEEARDIWNAGFCCDAR